MPDRLHGWRTGSNDGNPTKCAEVNDIAKFVKKLEARKQGAASQTRRPMVETEFGRLHEVLKTFGGPYSSGIWKFGMPAIIDFQFYMIARIDDATQVILDHIQVHDNFDNALKTWLNWSKNVQDERDAPWQIILASMNPVYCVYISLGFLWLESNLRSNASAMASPYVFSFSDDVTTIPGGGLKAKDTMQNIFGQKVLKLQEFQNGGLLGSDSIRKFASTHVGRCGISKDDKDTRGRWKGKGRVSDRYDDVELPYPDCKVAEKFLCMGGACYYVNDSVVCDSNILKTFILTKVVLGKTILWLVYSNASCNFISVAERDRVKTDLAETGIVIVDGQNPIAKVPIIVSGDQGTVYIDELPRLPLPAGVDGIVDNDGAALQGLNAQTLNRQILENNQNSGDILQNWMLQLHSGFMSLRMWNFGVRLLH